MWIDVAVIPGSEVVAAEGDRDAEHEERSGRDEEEAGHRV